MSQADSSTKTAPIVFVCLHGSAKSVIAAAHFRTFVSVLGKAIPAIAAGTEPDGAFPPHVLEGLRRDGVSPGADAPLAATRELLRGASHVVSFGPDVSAIVPPGCEVVYWKDVPNVSDGYAAARDEIVKRVAMLVEHEVIEESGLAE